MSFKKITPKNVALVDAILVSLVYMGAFVIISYIWFEFKLVPFMISTPLVFIVNYFIIRYSFNTIIFNRIKLIYKVIGKFPGSRSDDLKNESDNPLETVQEVVYQWSEEKNREIEELKQMAVYRREFLGNVSHELKTPIFNIQGYVSTLLDGGLEDNKINRRFLTKTEKSIERLINIVNDLESISRLESGEATLKEKPFNLYELVDEVLDFMEMKAQKSDTILSVKPELPAPFMVVADKEAIREVLINLVDNAIKYGDKQNNKVRIKLYDMDEKVLTEITDNGIGISQELLPRVFERFFRTDKGRSRDKGGSGLGLAIVKHIIEAHRQTITARSNIGEGTTFSFTLQKAK
jgi:two-component system phosphate regulon sensor histidine kinase PhoR